MEAYIRPRSDPFAGQCPECALRPTWKGNLYTLLVVLVVLGAILS
jgi:hypothetical protein